MSKLPGWLGQLGGELTRLGERLDERRAASAAEDDAAVHEETPVRARAA